MGTQLWIRNPYHFMRQVEDMAEPLFVFHVQGLRERGESMDAIVDLHFGEGQPFRALLVDPNEAIELRPGYTVAKPYARYPTWMYGVKDAVIERYLDEEEMVVINGLPPFQEPYIDFYVWLSELQRAHPDGTIHIHGGNAFRLLFGLEWKSVDFDPMSAGKLYQPILPCGKQLFDVGQWAAWGKWFRLIGYDWRKINTRAQIIEFNITSAHWAAEYYRESVNFKIRGKDTEKEIEFTRTVVPERGNFLSNWAKSKAVEGDKIICDACSLASKCKLYREGSVCTLPGESETGELAKMFRSRNAQTILDGLSRLVEMNVGRLEEGLSHERESEEGIDGEVTKLISAVIDQGVKLAKLRDPSLQKPGVQVNVGIMNGTHQPHQLAAIAIGEIEAMGWPRTAITMDMVRAHLSGQPLPQPPLELPASSIFEDDDDVAVG